MLKRVGAAPDQRQYQVTVGEAEKLALFSHHPEFNPPAHGVWNIVHVGMLVPEVHQIYVCGVNCMRGVVLTAAEMGQSQRFSMVLLEEDDLIQGTVEDVTLEGVASVLEKLPKLPPAVMVFTVCTHRFLGCDLDYIYHNLERRFPTVRFLRCFMEPITQKEGLSPDQRLRKTMYDPLPVCPPREKTAAILGSDFRLEDGADLRRMLENSGWALLEIQNYSSYADYLKLGQAEVMLSTFPRGRYGAEETAKRLSRRYFDMPGSFSYEEIARLEETLAAELGLVRLDDEAERKSCEKALEQAKAVIGEMPIAIDYTLHPRPLGLARLLLEHGFRVERIYLDAVTQEEQEDFRWLQNHTPELLLIATTQPQLRMRKRGSDMPVLALGQIAAWAEGTPWFVNLVEGGGLWGYDGIRTMAQRMIEAAQTKKDTRDLVPRKGLGCESLI